MIGNNGLFEITPAVIQGSAILGVSARGGDGGTGGPGGRGGSVHGGGLFLGTAFSFGDESVLVTAITDTLIAGNTARGGDGASGAAGGNAQGGGLYSDPTSMVSLGGCSIVGNGVKGGLGGGTGIGGGIYLSAPGSVMHGTWMAATLPPTTTTMSTACSIDAETTPVRRGHSGPGERSVREGPSAVHDPLQAAVEHHESGQLQDAVRLYQAVLARDPDHPDALHLLGVVAHQLGRPPSGGRADRPRRSPSARPTPTYHANLAEVWRTPGPARPGGRLLPHRPAAPAGLPRGRQQPRAGPARKPATGRGGGRALPSRPGTPAGFRHGPQQPGRRPARPGRHRRGRRALPPGRAVRPAAGRGAHQPRPAPLRARASCAEALEHCGRAVRLRPDLAEAHSNLGNVLRETGPARTRRGATTPRRCGSTPAIAMIYNNMARLLQEEGRLDEALAWYSRALGLDPDSPRDPQQPRQRCWRRRDATRTRPRTYEAALRLDLRCAAHTTGWASSATSRAATRRRRRTTGPPWSSSRTSPPPTAISAPCWKS